MSPLQATLRASADLNGVEEADVASLPSPLEEDGERGGTRYMYVVTCQHGGNLGTLELLTLDVILAGVSPCQAHSNLHKLNFNNYTIQIEAPRGVLRQLLL